MWRELAAAVATDRDDRDMGGSSQCLVDENGERAVDVDRALSRYRTSVL